MSKRRWTAAAAAASIVVVLSTMLPATASAEDSGTARTLETLQSLTKTAEDDGAPGQEVLSDLAEASEVDTERDGSLSMETGDDTTTIPAISTEPISIGDVEIAIPSPVAAAAGDRIDDAVMSFDNNDGSATVPILKMDGSVQVTTIISEAGAPTYYDYDIKLPEGAAMSIDEAGIVTASVRDKFVLGIAPAWAVDAEGAAVPTHYEIDGTTLRQVVEHRTANFTYPVVADPWVGVRLFDRVWVSGPQHVSMVTSAWGRAIQATGGGFGWAAGQMILNDAGWSEAVSAVAMLKSKPTYQQQYQCHVLGAYTPASGGPSWDLEGWRANRPWWRTDGGAFPHKCNWP